MKLSELVIALTLAVAGIYLVLNRATPPPAVCACRAAEPCSKPHYPPPSGREINCPYCNGRIFVPPSNQVGSLPVKVGAAK